MARRWVFIAAWMLVHAALAAGAAPRFVVTTAQYRFMPGDEEIAAVPLTITRGTELVLANADVFIHSIRSVDVDADDEPIFDSRAIAIGETAVVAGVSDLPPGVYAFYCGTHSNDMRGSLTVLDL